MSRTIAQIERDLAKTRETLAGDAYGNSNMLALLGHKVVLLEAELTQAQRRRDAQVSVYASGSSS